MHLLPKHEHQRILVGMSDSGARVVSGVVRPGTAAARALAHRGVRVSLGTARRAAAASWQRTLIRTSGSRAPWRK